MAFDATTFMERFLAKPSEPSRRSNKQRSGRTGNKQHHSRQALAAVGGKVSPISAIYNGRDGKAETDEPTDLCVIVTREVKAVAEPRDAPLPMYRPQGTYNYVGRVGCV
jgi:hypothetical protein